MLQKCYDYGLRDAMELCPFDQYIPDNCRKDGYIQFPDFNGDGSVSSILMCPACDESTCGNIFIDPVHEISNNVACAISKASDQPAHMHSLLRAFASPMNII